LPARTSARARASQAPLRAASLLHCRSREAVAGP